MARQGYGIVSFDTMSRQDLTREEKALYSLICSVSAGVITPSTSNRKLAEWMGCEWRSITRWKARLVEAGALKVVSESGRADTLIPLYPEGMISGVIVNEDGPLSVETGVSPGTGLTHSRDPEKDLKPPTPQGEARSQSTVTRARANHGLSHPKPIITFDWDTGEFVGISDQQVKKWEDTFPAVNVDGEIGRAAAWLAADRRRAKSQYGRFLVGWLTRAQDRGGSRPWASDEKGRRR